MRKLLKNSSLFIFLWIWVSLFLIGTISAQTLYIGSTGSMSNIGSVYVQGNISNDGTVKNKGTITMTGDLTVTGTWTSTGTESFSGPGIQTINSTISGANYLGYWIKNNIGKINLSGNIDCDSIAFLTDLPIDAATVTVKVKSGLSTAIKGYNSLRYIDVDDSSGILSRNISATSTYVFPIGNNVAGYRRFDVLMTNLGATGTNFLDGKLINGSPGTINFHKLYSTGFNGTYPSACTPGSNAQYVDFECMATHYWNFSGPSDYRFTTLAHALPCTPSGNGPRRVIKSPAGSGFWTNNIETVVGTLTDQLCINSDWTASASAIPGGTYQGFGDFGIAGTFGSPLPVELISLTATPINNEFIRLNWQTASESDNAGFEIQRSTDGIIWENIGWIDGHGNSTQIQSYQLDDYDVAPTVLYYYRLKQVDYSGAFKISSVVSAKINGIDIKVSDVFPSPGNSTQSLPVFLPVNTTITISCMNVLGQEIWDKKFAGVSGNQNILLDDVFAKGLYILQIQIGSEYFVRKFEKQ